MVDPFAGGGAIPLEALRVGADAFASDLNPVAVLLNKVVLEYIPKYGKANDERGMMNDEQKKKDSSRFAVTHHSSFPPHHLSLAEAVRYWGNWIKEQAEQELAEFYPKDPDGATPIAYLWARTIISEAPDDGTGIPVEVPLIRSLWLAKKSNRSVALRWVRDATGRVKTETVTVKYLKRNDERGMMNDESKDTPHSSFISRTVRRPLLEIFEPKKASEVEDGTVARGSATCPVTGYTTPVASVRRQLKERRGGAADARLFAVVTTRPGQQGRFYRLPIEQDLEAAQKAAAERERRKQAHTGPLSLVPNEPLPPQGTLGFRVQLYGMEQWGDLFTPRQALALTTLTRLVGEVGQKLAADTDSGFALAVQTCLALAVSRQTDYTSSLCSWHLTGEKINHTFGRQALPMIWDFTEVFPLSGSSGDFSGAIEWVLRVCEVNAILTGVEGHTERTSATVHPLPDDSAQAFVTDPPYYDAVPYADLSDFFIVWLKRTISDQYPSLFVGQLAPKADECIVDEVKGKDKAFFEVTMGQAMAEGRRILAPNGIGLVVFAHKSTGGWEAQLQAMVDAGWTMTGSWPIDTEMGSRLRAMDSAALASSIHLVCRPRNDERGKANDERGTMKDESKNIHHSSFITHHSALVGDWRDVLQELPPRIHAWLPRLAQEGVVGADAIFACLGPALEIFSRYSRVEKASGEPVLLKEYLEQVWAAVSKEALSMVFSGADATGFEEDARLTAMWLWTLNTNAEGRTMNDESEMADDESASDSSFIIHHSAFTLEYDAARKIAQGLGAHLERLGSLVEVKGETARLLPVSARGGYLFGKDSQVSQAPARPKKRSAQLPLFENAELGMMNDEKNDELGMMNAEADSSFITHHSSFTILDRVHQSMLLFAAGRSDTLKRFLVDEGVGQNARFWQLANALSALYPPGTEEKRWVEGVLARKKGLGF